MSRSSIHRVVFRSDKQWESGPHQRLRAQAGGGLTLSPRPALERWMQITDRRGRPLDRPLEGIETDACGQVFWIARETGELVRWNPFDGTEDGRHPMRVVDDAAGPVIAGGLVWVLDRRHARLLGFDAQSFQIIRELGGFTEPTAFAFDGRSRMYVADAEGLHILSDLGVRESIHRGPLKASDMAADNRTGFVYVSDTERGIIRFGTAKDGASRQMKILGAPFTADGPTLLAASDGTLLVAQRGGSEILLLDPGGEVVGTVELVEEGIGITSLARARSGRIFAATERCEQGRTRIDIAVLGPDAAAVGEVGVFCTMALDVGLDPRWTWRRALLSLVLPAGAVVEATWAFAHSGETAFRDVVDALLDDEGISDSVRFDRLDDTLAHRWQGPQVFRVDTEHEDDPVAADAEDVVSDADEEVRASLYLTSPADVPDSEFARYVWIRLRLLTYERDARPGVRRMDVIRQCTSYIDELPAIFQRDPSARDFLDRLLSTFETGIEGLEAHINALPQLITPDIAPPQFLPWLAGWLDMDVDQAWSEKVQRSLVAEANELNRQRGTPRGLARLLTLVTGRTVMVVEPGREAAPLLLGAGPSLGAGAALVSPRSQGLQLGERSVLGASLLTGLPPVEPTLTLGQRCNVLIDLPPRELAEQEAMLRGVVNGAAPAQCEVRVLPAVDGAMGRHGRVGVTALGGPSRATLGDAVLGMTRLESALAVAARLDADARLDGDIRII